MSIKDILDTPIGEMWNVVSGFVTGYLIFFAIFFLLVLLFIVYVSTQVFKGHKDFNGLRNKNKNKRR